MLAAMDIAINKVDQSKLHGFNLENLPFGKYFTDHMLEADYEHGEWKNRDQTLSTLVIKPVTGCTALWPVDI